MVTAIRNELSDTGSVDFRALMAIPPIRWKMDRVTFSTDYRLFSTARDGERLNKAQREKEREGKGKRGRERTHGRKTIHQRNSLGWREESAVMAGAAEIRIHRGGGELERREIFFNFVIWRLAVFPGRREINSGRVLHARA